MSVGAGAIQAGGTRMILGRIRSRTPEGAPAGVRQVTIDGQSLTGFWVPADEAPAAQDLTDLAESGIYFLLAPPSVKDGPPRAYLASTSALADQLVTAVEDPPLPWQGAAAFPIPAPRPARFHSELTKLVQFHCHRRARAAGHHELVTPEPAAPSRVPAFIDRDLKVTRTAMQTLLSAMGHPVLGEEAPRS